MPVLKTSEQIKKFFLPSTKDLPETDENKAWVVMDISSLKAGDMMGVGSKSGEAEIALVLLHHRIKDWNYTDESGAKLPINSDTVRLLDMDDFTYLSDQLDMSVDSLSDTEKKT